MIWFHYNFLTTYALSIRPYSLILVTKNVNLIEVYFLRGRDIGEEDRDTRSQLPGMPQFYSKMRVAKFFARLNNMWTGVCCDN